MMRHSSAVLNRFRLASALAVAASSNPVAAELQPATVAAFERYERLTETRLDGASPFLWLDGLPDSRRAAAMNEVKAGRLVIERLESRDRGREVAVPDGLIHHWMGTAFVSGTTIDAVLALLQDYDAHDEVYRPIVERSERRSRDGDHFTAFLRFRTKKVITVVVNGEHDARFSRPAPDRAEGRIHSTRIAEVENPGTPEERERPVGNDGGYLWRLNTYWRLLARDGGVYIQCESISLTRGIPFGVGWIVRPFVTSIPRESLTFTLETTRRYLDTRR